MNNLVYLRPGIIGRPSRCYITHRYANEVSWFIEPSDPNYCEAAFFNNDEWVNRTIPELSLWSGNFRPDPISRVYRYIPTEVMDIFLYNVTTNDSGMQWEL